MAIELEQNNDLNCEDENKIDETKEQQEPDIEDIDEEIPEPEKDKITLIGEFIREKSMECAILKAEDLLDEPFLLEVEEVLPTLDELHQREEFKDIYTVKGRNVIYLFSDKHITHNYANMMVLVEEKDLLKLVADTVRFDSKTYPRPTDCKSFSYEPFKLSKQQFDEVLKQLSVNPKYSDIKESRASNGAVYLYSDEFLTEAHADYLTEWEEVGRSENP